MVVRANLILLLTKVCWSKNDSNKKYSLTYKNIHWKNESNNVGMVTYNNFFDEIRKRAEKVKKNNKKNKKGK